MTNRAHMTMRDSAPNAIKSLKARVALLARKVNVGIPVGKNEPDGTPMALVGAVHEFGSPENGIPERSWLRSGLRINLPFFRSLNKRNLPSVLKGEMQAETALAQLGAVAVGKVQENITKGDFAPLKAQTIRRKGSSKPLIDSGNMRQSVTYQIVDPA